MAVAVDQLTEMVLKSVRAFLEGHLVGPGKDYSGVWLAHQDFDHGKRPDDTERALPYVAIEYESEEAVPYEIGDRRTQRNIDFRLLVACEDYTSFLRRPAQVQQLLLTTDVDGVAGAVPLLDFDAGGAAVGAFEVMTGEIQPFLDIETKRKWRNRKPSTASTVPVSDSRVPAGAQHLRTVPPVVKRSSRSPDITRLVASGSSAAP
jgi:hypothetical protein